jgi:hypothetical protein
MSAMNLAFVLQHEIPIWILSYVTLFLFHAPTNIGGKYSNIILLLVSYISIISSFRLNNEAQSTITLYELKLMVLTIPPILLIITTSIDYYNPNLFDKRSNQIENPFAYVSLIIVLLCFTFTVISLIYLLCTNFLF